MGATAQIAGAFISLQASQAQAKAANAQAAAYQEQAEMAKIEAGQQESQRRLELRQQLASLNSSMSAQGVALGSASQLALEADEMNIAKKDIRAIQLMGGSNRRKYQLSAAGAKAEARATRLGGFSSFASTMGQTFPKGPKE